MTIAYWWWGIVVVCRIVIVIGYVDVWWVVHFALHKYIPHWLRVALPMDAFLVVISHMRVLKYDTHGSMVKMGGTVMNATRLTWTCNWWRAG